MTAFTAPDSLPAHYDAKGQWCSYGGTVQEGTRCPRGCDHADHYSNDGHEACEDIPQIPQSDADGTVATVLLQGHVASAPGDFS